jgi:hypothetical protein
MFYSFIDLKIHMEMEAFWHNAKSSVKKSPLGVELGHIGEAILTCVSYGEIFLKSSNETSSAKKVQICIEALSDKDWKKKSAPNRARN